MHVCIFVPVPAVFIHEGRASVSLRLTWDLLFQLSSPSCLLSLLCELIPCMTATLILFTDSFHPRQNKPSWYVSGCRSGSFFSWMSQHWFLAPCNKAVWSMSAVHFSVFSCCHEQSRVVGFPPPPVFTVDCVSSATLHVIVIVFLSVPGVNALLIDCE